MHRDLLKYRFFVIILGTILLTTVIPIDILIGENSTNNKNEILVDKSISSLEERNSPRSNNQYKEVWNVTFGGDDWDCGYSVQETSDGNIIVCGETHTINDNTYAILIKVDSNGSKIWERKYGIGGINAIAYDYSWSVIETADNGFVLAGNTNYNDSVIYHDAVIIKTDSSGKKSWHKTFNGGKSDFVYSIQETKDNGYILTGYTYSYNSNGDILLIKTNSTGDELWTKTFNGGLNDEAWSVKETTDGGFIITGATENVGNSSYDIWVIKTDKNANEKWNKYIGGNEDDFSYSIQLTSDGGYIIVGETNSYGAGNQDIWLVKINSTGVEQWNRTFGGSEWDEGKSVQETVDGGFIIGGYTNSFGAGQCDVWLIKTDSSGNEKWNMTFGGVYDDEAFSVIQTSSGGYVITGGTKSFAKSTSRDIWLIKINLTGSNQPPIADAGPDQNVYVNQTVYFNGSGTYDPDGDTLTYKWSFGDGTSTNWQYNCNSSHVYNKSGKYTVTLFVTDGAGGWPSVIDTCIIRVTKGPQLANSPWPMFRQNPRHTGLSPYNTKFNNGQLKWKFTIGNSIQSSPSIGSKNIIYVASDDNQVYAFHPDGTKIWNYTTGGDVTSSPAISLDGTIYIGSQDHKFYAINRNGTLKWSFFIGDDMSRSSPAIGADGTIYVGSENYKLYALNPNGTEKWNFTAGDMIFSSPGIDSNGTIYIGSMDKKLYAINPDGTMKWSFTTSSGISWSSPAIGSDGTIYIGSKDNRLYAIFPNGTEKWKFSTNSELSSSPAIDSNGVIYIGSNDHNLWAIYPNGTKKWTFMTNSEIYSSPAIGSEGTIFIGSRDHNLYAISPNGTKKWNFTTQSVLESSPTIGPNGTIYIGGNDGILYAIGSSSQNQPPIANAGSDQNVYVNQTVNFDGSGSYDPDGDTLSYKWSFGDGTSTNWQYNCNSSHVYNKSGKYTVTLFVNDGAGGWPSVNDTCIIHVSQQMNYTPIIKSNFPTLIELDEDFGKFYQKLTEYESHLNQELTGDKLKWYVTGDSKTIFNISGDNSTGVNTDRFELTSIPDQYGTENLTFHLRDPFGFEAIIVQKVIVSPVNDRPLAEAGLDRNISVGQIIELDGTRSYDIDGDNLTYQWMSSIDGILGNGSILKNIKLSAGIHTITLNVSDGEFSDINTCIIRVSDITGNLPPVAKISPIIQIYEGKPVLLSAINSFDEDGFITTYIWNFGDDSKEIVTNKTDVQHTWSSAGNYTITLTVIDNRSGTSTDSLKIIVIKSDKTDPDGDGQTSQEYTFAIILIAIVIIILLIIATSKLFLTRSKRQREKKPETDEEILNNMKLNFLQDETLSETDYSRDEITILLEKKLKAGQVSDQTYHIIKSEVLFSKEPKLKQMNNIESKGK